MIGESVWFDQSRVEAAENVYQEAIGRCHSGLEVVVSTQLASRLPHCLTMCVLAGEEDSCPCHEWRSS